MNELPKEITFPPAPYIALIALDAANNAEHNVIWNTFAINRATDRPQLYYKLISVDHTFPVAKEKKSYDRYIPNGILKTNWLSKHLFEIPSVAVIFEEANWESLQNSDVRTRCIEKITRVRNSLNGRQTKIVLILLQSSSIALTDDSIYKDSATKLCSDCDINPKSLFIIPTNEHQLIAGYILRIEQVILELAKTYYVAQAKTVKSHKDLLNKSSQIYLYIRHEFKLGFLHEIRQIYNTALGHYKNAYVSLMEIRTNSLNIFEIKSIASLLNYKICCLSFYLNIPMDAISHFRKHIEIFQNKFSSNQIEFEHHAWLSEQFFIFAELFEMAVNSFSLSPSSIQHPGVYYFESALFLIERRRSASLISPISSQASSEETNFLASIVSSQHKEYIGQFAWNNELPDSEKLIFTFKALQYKELQVDHTKLLISLYVNVLNQIRKFKKPRFMRYLMYLIGDEYYNLANYEEALTYFCKIFPFYRDEKWNEIYFKIVELALNSSYLSTDLGNFIKFSFEQMSNQALTDQDRTNLLNCIISFLSLKFQKLQLSEGKHVTSNQQLEDKWIEILNNVHMKETISEISILMDKEIDFLDCKIAFSSPQYFIGDKVNITVAIFSSLPLDITNLIMQVKFVNPHYDQFCVISKDKAINLKSKSMSTFNFEFKPLLEDIGKEIRVCDLILKLVSKQIVSFQWSLLKQYRDKLPSFCAKKDEKFAFTKFNQVLFAKILEHNSKLNVEVFSSHDVYVNEHSLVKLRFESKENYPISNLQLSVKLMTSDDQIDSNFAWLSIQSDKLDIVEGKQTIVERLMPNQTIDSKTILKLFTTGNKLIIFNFCYDLILENDQKVQFILVQKQIIHQIDCVQPFSAINSLSNLGSSDTANIRVAEPFKLNIDIVNQLGNNLIEVAAMRPCFSDNCDIISHNSTSQFPFSLSEQSTLKDSYLLSCSRESPSTFSLGHCLLQWTRKENSLLDIPKNLLLNETTFPLPSTCVVPSLVFVELQLPEACYARSSFMVRYIIHNRLDVDVTVEISMGMSDCFMISGNKLIKLCIKGKLFLEQTYIFFPLLCGELALPQLGISVHLAGQNPVPVDYISQMMSPTVKVLPQLRS